jgi:hypothetical protein
VSDGSSLTIHSDTGTLMVDGRDFRADQLSPMTARIQAVGGIVPALQRYREETFDVLAGARGR